MSPAERWLVTGASGQLGLALVERLAGHDVTALSHHQLDVTSEQAVADAVAEASVVVNTAAWTAVDAAEQHEDAAWEVNAWGAENLARACADHGAILVHLSTDYVFAGDSAVPYSEAAPTQPRSAYGRTKAAGERQVLTLLPQSGYVVRTAWLYGAGGRNFVRTMIRLEREIDEVDVVTDQRGQPTWTTDLADLLVRLVERRPHAGVYHGTASGETSWFGLAQAVFEEIGADPGRVRPVTGAQVERLAPRPAYSVLGHDAWAEAGIAPIGPWRDRLAQAVPALVRSESA